MNRMMKPRAIAVVGASAEEGKIGNSVMKNLVNGGFEGEIYPINPKADEILGKKAYPTSRTCPTASTSRCSPSRPSSCVDAIAKVGDKGIAGRDPHPVRLRRDRREELQHELVETAREHGVRFIGPNIYGFYYTPENMSAAFTTPYDVHGQRRAGVAERRHRHGDPRLQPLDQAWASRRSSASATRPTSTRTTC